MHNNIHELATCSQSQSSVLPAQLPEGGVTSYDGSRVCYAVLFSFLFYVLHLLRINFIYKCAKNECCCSTVTQCVNNSASYL